MRAVVRFVVLAAAVGGLAAHAPAQPEPAWAGKRAMTKHGKVQLWAVAEGGQLRSLGNLNEAYARVDREEKDYLLVRSLGREGWLKKDDVVLMDTAVPYFTQRIGQNPND